VTNPPDERSGDPYSAPPPGAPSSGVPGSSGSPGYGAAPGPDAYGYGTSTYRGPARPPRNGLGVAALILGILALLAAVSILGGILLGLVAIILGVLGWRRAKRGEATNGGLAVVGLVTGSLAVLISAGLLALGVSVLQSPVGRDYQECIRNAGNDQAAVQRCAEQFGRSLQTPR
jgi:hypothetical protein